MVQRLQVLLRMPSSRPISQLPRNPFERYSVLPRTVKRFYSEDGSGSGGSYNIRKASASNSGLAGGVPITRRILTGNSDLPIIHGVYMAMPKTVVQLRQERVRAAAAGTKVGLVPTMGALHAGHLRLIRRAASECQQVYVSIYVNPTQFGVNEDLSTYPRDLARDLKMLDDLNVDLKRQGDTGLVTVVFQPDTKEMYPHGLDSPSYIAMDPSMTKVLEGKARPTFFQGVTTVVTKLLNIVQPEMVYFGQKDIQQLCIIRRMVDEFHIPTKVIMANTMRESNGLAMSSRNIYLGERRRQVATVLRRAISAGVEAYENGARNRNDILDAAINVAKTVQYEQRALPPKQRARFEVDYLSLNNPQTLRKIEDDVDDKGAVLSGAIVMLPLEAPSRDEKLGLGDDTRPVRLIDNAFIGGMPLNNDDTTGHSALT